MEWHISAVWTASARVYTTPPFFCIIASPFACWPTSGSGSAFQSMGNNWPSLSSQDYESKSTFGTERCQHSLKSCYMVYYPAINCFFHMLSSFLPLVFAYFHKFTADSVGRAKSSGALRPLKGIRNNIFVAFNVPFFHIRIPDRATCVP